MRQTSDPSIVITLTMGVSEWSHHHTKRPKQKLHIYLLILHLNIQILVVSSFFVSKFEDIIVNLIIYIILRKMIATQIKLFLRQILF